MDATRTSTAASIRLEGVRKQYADGTVAVADLTLEVPAGQIVVLVGPSGCGKSTVLRMVNRLIEPSAGTVRLDGADIMRTDPVKLRRRIGYVIQNVGLLPHQTVRGNVATVPKLLGWPKDRITDRVEELLDLVGLEAGMHGRRYPHELSGGQRQRVGLARALGADPAVLLMDEPFSAVDPIVRTRLQEEFLRLQESVRKTILFVTHDVDEAVRLGDQIAVLSEGGKLEQYAPPAEVLGKPASSFVASFVGADRGIKRLAVTPIPRDLLRPLSSVEGDDLISSSGPLTAATTPSVRVTATLRDALAELLEGDTGWVAVRDGDQRIGVLTLDDIYTALHRAQ